MRSLTVGLLGAFEVCVDGRPVMLRTGRLPVLLATLAMSAGRTVSVDQLVDAMWRKDQPDNARRTVQTYVTRIRGAIGAEFIATGPDGYALRTPPEDVDALRFLRLLDGAAVAAGTTTERDRLAEALELWRGTPFTGVRSAWLEETESPRLVERYLTGLERRIDLDIAAGRHGELAAELSELTAHHPLRESLWVRLLAVLDRTGRRAEAFDRYEAIRIRLADELGVDPGPELQSSFADLLAGRTPALPNRPAPSRPTTTLPRQLPADVAGFTGRRRALQALDALVGDGDRTVLITAIGGTAGIGKTALAVHWAHRVAHRFPDGQLYVNLRGFDPSGQAMDPAEAVRGFLDALQVPPAQIPAGLDSQAGLYRSLVAGKRMLVVLDNARDAEQVRPLLPGSPGCLVVVTSRNQLTSLVVAEGAHPVILDLLTTGEARELLARRLGTNRVTAQPDAVDEIIARCARLPLALATVAARAATYPDFSLGALAAELRGLEGFRSGDPVTDLPAAFSWSYGSLGPGAARLFRLLGLHPGPDLGLPAMVSLAGAERTATRTWLAELTRDHLVVEHSPARYTLHDLLRAYAAELSTEDDRGAIRRMVDHYLHTASAAATKFNHHHQDAVTPGPAEAGVVPERIDDHGRALAWFTVERRVLVAVVGRARTEGFDIHAWQLACTLTNFFDRRGYWDDLAATQRTALAAATHLGDRAAQATIHRNLSAAHARRGRYDEARLHLRHSLDLFIELGDHAGQARTHLNLAQASGRQGHHVQALAHAKEALDLYRLSEHRAGQANAFNAIGWYHVQLGQYRQALLACQRALALFQRLGDNAGEAGTWDSIGFAHHGLGDHEQALTCYHSALGLFRSLGDRYYEADTLMHLGETHRAAGDIDAAREAWQHALAILEEFGHTDTEHVRDRLRRLVESEVH